MYQNALGLSVYASDISKFWVQCRYQFVFLSSSSCSGQFYLSNGIWFYAVESVEKKIWAKKCNCTDNFWTSKQLCTFLFFFSTIIQEEFRVEILSKYTRNYGEHNSENRSSPQCFVSVYLTEKEKNERCTDNFWRHCRSWGAR